MSEPVAFTLPKKPRVKQKDAPPDARSLAVIPIRAGKDERLRGSTLRCLIVLCSYCNRAGVTWVGQAKLAQDLKISRQAVTKQIKLLTEAGYVQLVNKGFRGERTNTIRVIFDPTVDTQTAISITSAQEDTRPPYMKQEQEQDLTPDIEGLKRIAQIIKGAVKPVKPKKEYTMPKDGQTITTKRIKADIEKAKAKRTHRQPPEVANEDPQKVANEPVDNSLHRQPLKVATQATSEGCAEHSLNSSKVVYKEYLDKYLKSHVLVQLRDAGLTDSQIASNLEHLVAAYLAEGLTPNPDRLGEEILRLAKVG